MEEPAVKLEISKEALEAYKQMYQPDYEERNRKTLHIRLMPDGMSFGDEDWPDIDDFLNVGNQIAGMRGHMMYGKLPQDYFDSLVSIKDKASMLLKVYADTYNDIVEGYENGTREKYVVDMKAEDLYRKVTMEEELGYLREELETQARDLEITHKYDCKVRADMAVSYMDEILSGGLRKALRYNMAYHQLKEEEKIANIKQSMLDAAAVFVNRHKEFGFQSALGSSMKKLSDSMAIKAA